MEVWPAKFQNLARWWLGWLNYSPLPYRAMIQVLAWRTGVSNRVKMLQLAVRTGFIICHIGFYQQNRLYHIRNYISALSGEQGASYRANMSNLAARTYIIALYEDRVLYECEHVLHSI